MPPHGESNIKNYGSIECIDGSETAELTEDVMQNTVSANKLSVPEQVSTSMRSLRNMSTSFSAESVRDLVHESLRFGGERCSVRHMGGTATIATEVFNLSKNIIATGMLALPGGVASYADSPDGLFPGLFWTVVMGAIFGYNFLLIGRTCGMCYAATYRECWVETMGSSGSALVSLVTVLKPALGNLAYSMVLADTFKPLFIAYFGWESCTRWEALLIVTFVALWPLCFLKNLNVLAPTSIIGIVAFVLTAVVMAFRYYDGSYSETGQFAKDLPENLKPSFGTTNDGWASFNVLVLVCMLFEAFVAHYNAPRFFIELKDRTIPRFAVVVLLSFGFSATLFYSVMVYGFLTFGKNCDGFILNNYSTSDQLANFCRICIAVALICSYPITFLGVRDGVLDLFEVPMNKHTSTNLNIVSTFLLAIITMLALVITDLGLISAFCGGTMATIVAFVFPALMFRKAVQSQHTNLLLHSPKVETYPNHIPKWKSIESEFSIFLMFFGIVVGVVGVYLAFKGE